MRNILILTLLIIGASTYGAPGSFNDLFHIGFPGTTSNTELEVGDTGSFRYNFATSKMQVTHDGITYNDVTPTLAKGGLITSNGTNNTIEAVGANTYILTADSAQANGVKWAPAASSDHTLTSTNTLQNKTLDTTNKIAAEKHGAVIELGDDSIVGLGDRATFIDMHGVGSVDYSHRFVRNTGANGTMYFDQQGTGSTHFFNQNVNNLTLTSAQVRVEAGAELWLAYNGTGPNGNVPHACIIRSSSGTQSVGASCASGEISTGGGCQASSSFGKTFRNYPFSATTWWCQSDSAITITTYSICCQY